MPYRRTYRRKRVSRRRPVRANYTRKIARREAYKAINKKTETKYIDGTVAGAITAISSTGSLFSLHGTYGSGSFQPIVQGGAYNEYIGQWIKPTWVKIRYALDIADTANIVTVIVIQAKGIWTNTGDCNSIFQTIGNTSAPMAPVDQAYSSRFRVLYRRQHNLNAGLTDVATGKITLTPRKLRAIHFSDDSGTVETGLLMIGFLSDSTAVTHPTLRMWSRFYFKDS